MREKHALHKVFFYHFLFPILSFSTLFSNSFEGNLLCPKQWVFGYERITIDTVSIRTHLLFSNKPFFLILFVLLLRIIWYAFYQIQLVQKLLYPKCTQTALYPSLMHLILIILQLVENVINKHHITDHTIHHEVSVIQEVNAPILQLTKSWIIT